MASSQLPAPGTTYGPCETDCKHIDCAFTKRQAAQTCRMCECRIGYSRVYRDPQGIDGDELVHAACLDQ